MGLAILDRQIDRIFIIDDNASGRESWNYTIEESPFEAVIQEQGVSNLSDFLNSQIQKSDAVVSDHHLMKKNYFPENGAKVVFECYERKIPSVLVTSYGQYEVNDIRKFRENIPVVLNPEEFSPETLIRSLEICINEFAGNLRPERIPWRTLIRVDDVVEDNIFISLPGWDPRKSLVIYKKDIPAEIARITKPDMYLHAKVNIGAENSDDLFFKEWENK